MKYQVTCEICSECIWIHGVYEPDTNAIVLDDNDWEWDNGCDHIKAGDYCITPDEDDDSRYDPNDNFDPGIPKPGM